MFFTQDLQPKLTEYVELILNTEEQETQSDVYPNPSNGLFAISLNENEHAQIYIHDQTGKLIQSLQSIGSSTLDLSDRKAGFYYLTVYTNGKAKRIKLVKN